MSSSSPGPRVVSLVPSVTETLLAWGVTPLACTRFCEQPTLTQVGGTKNPDVDAIAALDPELVVMCDEENRREDADALGEQGIRVHSCSPRGVADVGPALVELAAALGLDPADATTGGPVPDLSPLGLAAFVPIWRRPWMSLAADTYGASLLGVIGVTNVYADAGDRYPEVDLADVALRAPDVVVVPSEPYAFKPAHLDELRDVAPVLEVDGEDLFWWGVRTPAAIHRLHVQLSDFPPDVI